MALADTLKRLYERRRFGIRPGVERVRTLLDRLGNPENSFRTVHVVGTNGKGSTSSFLASILTASGRRTALFTSPHLISFTERFRINGEEITPERLEPLLDTVLGMAPAEATFFEIVTALAVLYFSEEHADIAVMEAGMGGRSDATASLHGIMTVITPISLDHCDFLGTTLEEIAVEKSGIAKPGTPIIIGRQPALVQHALTAAGVRCCDFHHWMEQSVAGTWNSQGTLDYKGLKSSLYNIAPGIPGRYQADNACLALMSAEVLGTLDFSVDEAALLTGIRDARLAGRMELIPGSPPLILDGAHNPAGAAALAESLALCSYRRLLMVIGVMSDKDVPAIVSLLTPLVVSCYCVRPAVERAMEADTLAEILTGMGIDARPSGSVAEGIIAAQADATPEDAVVVCGSLFTVGEAKAWLTGRTFEGIRG
jgi:dihydrofolate synthase/folylpolyglutamate synthase